MKALRIVVAALLALCATAALAQENRRYAVLSLVGDRLLISVREMSTGSRLDPNRRTYVPLEAGEFDAAVVGVVDSELRRLEPKSDVVLLVARDPAIFDRQAKALDSAGGSELILSDILKVAQGADATHLVLVTKLRHEAMLRVAEGHVGSGYLEGLGFYVDRSLPMMSTRTGESFTGFLAPFVYARVSLIDLAASRVVKEEDVLASFTHGRQSALHPWDAMTGAQKVRALQSLVRSEIPKALARLMGRD